MKKELVQNCPIPRLPFLSNSILPFTSIMYFIIFFYKKGYLYKIIFQIYTSNIMKKFYFRLSKIDNIIILYEIFQLYLYNLNMILILLLL